MTAPQIKNIEIVLESWMGPMAKFVLAKQLEDAAIDQDVPTKGGLENLVKLLENKCLAKMVDPERAKDIKKDLLKAIDAPTTYEDDRVIELNKQIHDYLRKEFGDVAVYTVNMEKKRLGIDEIKDVHDYIKLAEQIRKILGDLVGEKIAKKVHDGLVTIINHAEEA